MSKLLNLIEVLVKAKVFKDETEARNEIDKGHVQVNGQTLGKDVSAQEGNSMNFQLLGGQKIKIAIKKGKENYFTPIKEVVI